VARKIIENLLYLGLAAMIGGLFYFFWTRQWDWIAQVFVYSGLGLVLVHAAFNFRAIRGALGGRAGRYGALSLATALVVIGILILLNFLNFRYHKRYDLSADQLYGLSAQTEKVVANLKGPIQVIGFYKDEQPIRRFQDLMQEYRYISSKVQSEVVDPEQDPARVEKYGIRQMGQIAIVNGAKSEIVDQATEEKITNAIIKLTRETTKNVYFLTGHQEHDISDSSSRGGYATAREALVGQNYRVNTLNLAQENKIPQDAAVIISAGPRIDFFPEEVTLLKNYLAGGGKLVILADPETDFKMTDFLGEYGVELTGKVILDALNRGLTNPVIINYSDQPVTRDLVVKTLLPTTATSTMFPLAQAIKRIASPLGYQVTSLFTSSPRSYAVTKLQGEETKIDEANDLRGPVDLGVASVKEMSPPASADKKPNESRLIVVGDSDFASNGVWRYGANSQLFLNIVSWMAGDTDLIAIRPREPENRMVNLTSQQSRLLFLASVIGLPLITLVIGVSVWYKRR
jgi:ABC-type uncharacterized transport system involved in gliding motility auxiliary subunit